MSQINDFSKSPTTHLKALQELNNQIDRCLNSRNLLKPSDNLKEPEKNHIQKPLEVKSKQEILNSNKENIKNPCKRDKILDLDKEITDRLLKLNIREDVIKSDMNYFVDFPKKPDLEAIIEENSISESFEKELSISIANLERKNEKKTFPLKENNLFHNYIRKSIEKCFDANEKENVLKRKKPIKIFKNDENTSPYYELSEKISKENCIPEVKSKKNEKKEEFNEYYNQSKDSSYLSLQSIANIELNKRRKSEHIKKFKDFEENFKNFKNLSKNEKNQENESFNVSIKHTKLSLDMRENVENLDKLKDDNERKKSSSYYVNKNVYSDYYITNSQKGVRQENSKRLMQKLNEINCKLRNFKTKKNFEKKINDLSNQNIRNSYTLNSKMNVSNATSYDKYDHLNKNFKENIRNFSEKKENICDSYEKTTFTTSAKKSEGREMKEFKEIYNIFSNIQKMTNEKSKINKVLLI